MATDYEIGDKPVITVLFKDVDGVAANPSTVQFLVEVGTSTTTYNSGGGAVTNPSVGTWKCAMDTIITAGVYQVRVTGTGTLVAAAQTSFGVKASNIV